MSTLRGVALAAVWTPNPNHPLTLVNFFGYLMLIIGCVIMVTGVVATVLISRGKSQKKWGDHVVGPFILAIGLVLAYFGVRLF